jgi:hypothetical protein
MGLGIASAVAVVSVLALVAAQTHRTPTHTDASLNTFKNMASIAVLLDQRGSALTTPDRAGFDATIVPGATDFLRQENMLFSNLTQFPHVLVEYYTFHEPNGLATKATTSYEGGVPHLHMDVGEYVELDKTTTPSFRMDLDVSMTFVNKDGSWYIAAESEPRDWQKDTYVRPWFGSGVEMSRSGSVIAVVDHSSSVSAGTLARKTQADIAADQQVLGITSRAPAVLVDATTNGSIHNWERNQVGAIFLTDQIGPLEQQRVSIIKANPRDIQQLLTDGQTLRHEVTHMLLASIDRDAATWATEGIAEYVGSYPREVTFAEAEAGPNGLAKLPKKLPTSATWGASPTYDYAMAHAAVLVLIQRSGMATFLKFLGAYTGRTPTASDQQTATELKRYYGMTPAQLAAEAYAGFRDIRWG